MLVQPVYLLVNTSAHIFQSVLGIADVGFVISDGVHEVHNTELVVPASAVHPDVPYKQRPHDLAVFLHVCFQIEHFAVVQRGSCAGTVQTLGIALIVLYGIDIGMEHILVVTKFLAQWCLALQKPVVIGIHACNHVGPEVIHQGSLLALAKGGSGGQHDLETDSIRLVLVQYIAPEGYVIITFHISHDAGL